MLKEPLIPNRLDEEHHALVILDQTLLPGEAVYRSLFTTEEICHAIRTLQVRGAPAIGIAAAYGVYLGARNAPREKAGVHKTVDNHSGLHRCDCSCILSRYVIIWI